MFDHLISLKNQSDFFLRQLFRVAIPVPETEETHELAKSLQIELRAFLALFNWEVFKHKGSGPNLKISDVGTRTFAFGPVIDSFFRDLGFIPEVHGIEIDAYRRFTNFKSRADYGRFYAKKIPKGYFHAMDFLKFSTPLDVVFMLNPFVTRAPLLNWGLPLKEFKPQLLFDHAHTLLRDQKGTFIFSSPTEYEFQLALQHAERAGFKFLEEQSWRPNSETLQKQPRFGALLSIPS